MALIFRDDSHFSNDWLARIKAGVTDNYRLKVCMIVLGVSSII